MEEGLPLLGNYTGANSIFRYCHIIHRERKEEWKEFNRNATNYPFCFLLSAFQLIARMLCCCTTIKKGTLLFFWLCDFLSLKCARAMWFWRKWKTRQKESLLFRVINHVPFVPFHSLLGVFKQKKIVWEGKMFFIFLWERNLLNPTVTLTRIRSVVLCL